MKRVLVLHGVGSSAKIMKDQIASLAGELGSDYEFIYLDGAVETERGPGIAPHYLGPFYSYTTGYTTAEIRDALDDLDQFVQENGPFNGVLGFSQGASIAASYLLDYQIRYPWRQPPFEFAVLFSSVSAFSPDETCYESIIETLLSQEFPETEFSRFSRSERIFAEYLALTFTAANKIGLYTGPIDFFKHRNPDAIPRVLHPSLIQDRIKIPTVHVNGKEDLPAMSAQSRLVCGFCDQSLARVYHHSGGHIIPAKAADVKVLVKMVGWAGVEGASYSVLRQALARIPQR
ncbi:inducible nitrate reductase 2 [Daldinia sp. FL1419]|nr:inducible nitrate reductase 2 [Daldinia sp. FL1419]